MYLSKKVVLRAISELSKVHPFFGITFLVFKRGDLPVGSMVEFPINRAEEEFLNHYFRVDLKSKHYFQPFKTSSRTGRWLSPKYPSSGSQSTRTRGRLGSAFLHDVDSSRWGWSQSYLETLRLQLNRDHIDSIPAFWLAVWIFRRTEFPSDATPKSVIEQFFQEFKLNSDEIDTLFNRQVPKLIDLPFSSQEFRDDSILPELEPPPDASPGEQGVLKFLALQNVGPVRQLEFYPGNRLSIITGDNGLGKTFILDCAWWSLTGCWSNDQQVMPDFLRSNSGPKITFSISSPTNESHGKVTSIGYDWKNQRWPAPKPRPTIPGLVLYARVDGSFAVWDPVRHSLMKDLSEGGMQFTRDQVMNGLNEKIEGLIRDWIRWQYSRDQTLFSLFGRVLERLSPPDMSPLKPGEPVRLPGDVREIPTLIHDYSVVPFTHESAGIKRIVAIAYLLVWSWNEHRINSMLVKRKPQESIVLIIDEVEAHLHPKWQRIIMPAILDVLGMLGNKVNPQVIIATHSPIVLASVEGYFSADEDKLFHLDLDKKQRVHFSEIPFLKYGTFDSWLTSEVFELKQARSLNAENVLEEAKEIFERSSANRDVIEKVHEQLLKVLPASDKFWPRWLHFAKMKGISL